ncbi:MAG: alkaline phosphatase [Phenylobacterium sp.]|uniref:alkaline phosphatase n=1 Tax=Phenylobacterium sp. TaxID=1871053 RepID=UPI00391DFA90
MSPVTASVRRARGAAMLAVLVLVAAPAAAASRTAAPQAAAAQTAAAKAAEPARARNVILFIGDGMGVSTLTAARIFEGQQRGVDGASNLLAFERFPDLALVRTYSADSLVTDSANGASAIMTGHRTINGALGVSDAARRDDCASGLAAAVPTLAEIAKRRGMAAGAVTTAMITDATPAALYAHSPSRGWQSDAMMPKAALDAGCVDIARQLVEAPEAVRLDLVMGGGAAVFAPAGRKDGRDLAAAWAARPGAAVVRDAQALAALPARSGPVLGLFASGNMAPESARPASAPRLVDMTRKAIDILSQDKDGYFLMVEGALIDKSHHVGRVRDALVETVEFAQAVAAAAEMTDPADTLIIVTADHSHGLTISGGERDTSVLALVPNDAEGPALALDGKPYPILAYATGPGGPPKDAPRADLTGIDTTAPEFVAPAAVPLASARHGGEDVAAYARGPGADQVRGLIDQPRIFQIMSAALGLPER